MSIREIRIAARGQGEDVITEPPARELSLAVIGDDAHLAVVDLDEIGKPISSTGGGDLIVPARSLLDALHAAISDAER